MSGSLSNHDHEDTRGRADQRNGQRTDACVLTEPELAGGLPGVPTPEEPCSAHPRDVTTQEPPSRHGRGAPALHEALFRAHQDPGFLKIVSRWLTQGGAAAPHILWRAVYDLLEKGPVGREAVAWDVVKEICRQSKKNPTIREAVPPLETIVHLVAVGPPGPTDTLNFITDNLPVNPLDVLSLESNSPRAPKGAQRRAFEFVQKNYSTLVSKVENHPRLAEILHDVVMRHDRMSLDACLFIRNRYEACRSWVGKEAERETIWRMRDQLTTTLLEAPERCAGNLKIALMYPHDVPHPSLQREPQLLTESERWILAEEHHIRQAVGHEYASKIAMLEAKGSLDSSSFVYMGAAGEKSLRGVQRFESRFDRDKSVLVPLARSLDVEIPGFTAAGHRDEGAAERPPRTWVNRSDRILYQASQVSHAFRCVAKHYWTPEVADRLRHNAREFLRAIMREQPEAFALAVPSLRDSGSAFFSEVHGLARDEAQRVCTSTPAASGEDLRIRNALILLHGFGSFSVDLSRLALEELALALRNSSAATMRDEAFANFVAAFRPLGQTSPALEAIARQAILSFPESLVASHLARTLSEAKAVDSPVRALINQQACRDDLEAAVWLNYAHSALLIGDNADTRARIRKVLGDRYDRSIRALSRWSSKARASYRILMGALCPERIGEITPLRNERNALLKSSLEEFVREAMAQLPDTSVRTNHYMPWAPAFDGVVTTTRPGVPAVVLLIDGERYHSVNGLWSFRGFDGHSLLATKIFQRAGHPVLRVTEQLGHPSEHAALRAAVSAAFDHLVNGGEVTDPRLVVDPDDDLREIAGKVLLYRPMSGEGLPRSADHRATGEAASDGVGAMKAPEGADTLESEEGEGGAH